MGNYKFIATAAFGIEAVVQRELKRMGIECTGTENGRVTFEADARKACEALINLRTADRLFLIMGEFRATTFDELFEGVKALDWPDLLPKNACFPVDGKSVKSKLFSISDCQAITKKAIVEKLKIRYNMSVFPEDGPKYPILVGLLKDKATLSVDLCGTGLHKRGYRKLTGDAPLRETLAAALIILSGWHPDRQFADLFCGTGTLPIEAAMFGLNMAPGQKRAFAADSWAEFGEAIALAKRNALDAVRRDQRITIHGSDIDEKALSMARYHAKQAGVESGIHFQMMDFKQFKSSNEYGVFICNPPYGERMISRRECEKLYADMGNKFAQFPTWGQFVLTADKMFESAYGKQALRRRKLYNGRIECCYYQYAVKKPFPRGAEADGKRE